MIILSWFVVKTKELIRILSFLVKDITISILYLVIEVKKKFNEIGIRYNFNMWVFTKKTFDNKPMFFQFQVKNNVCIFNFTNLKQIFSKDLHKSSLASTYSVSNTAK